MDENVDNGKNQNDEKMTLASLREKANLTQKQLADILGVTIQTISNWEQARAVPKLTVKQVITMLSVLPCSLFDLGKICDEIEQKVQKTKVESSKFN